MTERKATDLLLVGVITGAHGVRGLVRVKSFTQDPADLVAYGPLTNEAGNVAFTLDIRGETRGQFIVKMDGVTDRNQAEDLRGAELYLDRSVLPEAEEGEFYHTDLIGLDAILPDGTTLGTVEAVFDFGAGDLLDVKLAAGGSRLFAFTEEVVPTVDLEAGHVVIDPPEEVDVRAGVEPEVEPEVEPGVEPGAETDVGGNPA